MSPLAVDQALRDRLHAQVRRVCPPWMTGEIDDLVQMAVMRLIRGDPPENPPTSYLARVAYSVVVDEIRTKKRRNEVGMTPSLDERMVNSVEIGPEQLARSAQVGGIVLECVEALPVDRRRAVTLYLQGHPVPEIGEILMWPRKKASNAVYRGLADLRGLLAARGVEP